MNSLTQQERILVHQVHPAKLGADIAASAVSNTLLWRHRLVPGLLTRYLLPLVGSAFVLRFANVDRLADSTVGRHVLGHMPPQMIALRLAGDTLMAIGAWRRQPKWIALGVLAVGLGWSNGVTVL